MGALREESGVPSFSSREKIMKDFWRKETVFELGKGNKSILDISVSKIKE